MHSGLDEKHPNHEHSSRHWSPCPPFAIPLGVLADAEKHPQTMQFFQNALSRTFTVRSVNDYGLAELWLHPNGPEDATGGRDSIWVEPEFLVLEN